VIKDRIAAYGHRNWIVIADSAYPSQAREGIETISADTGQVEALKEVLADLSASRHVRPIAYIDQELKFIGDNDAPGVDAYRGQIIGLLPPEQTHVLLHEQLIKKLDEAAQTFRVLIVKTKETIPYTSVFLQLDCAYWSEESEKQLRARMAR
jgi:L-fucose mutarotase/ribose pyranase (RbsD/FucU family)